MYKVFINPGHCPGIDSGASGYGITEAETALEIGLAVQKKLDELGYETMLVQEDYLSDVCYKANSWNADLFVSIHCNACDATARGTECLHYPASSKSIQISEIIQEKIVNKLGTIDRGIKERPNLAVLRGTDMPATLVETAFIDQIDDNQLLKNNKDDFVDAIVEGIVEFSNQEYGTNIVYQTNSVMLDHNNPIEQVKENKKQGQKPAITREDIAQYVAQMLIETGVEGNYDDVTCASKADYPSIGISQWTYDRADNILKKIPGGNDFIGVNYSYIVNNGLMNELRNILSSEKGREVQLQQLADDCFDYVNGLASIPNLDDTRCLIYAATWATTSLSRTKSFIEIQNGYINIRSLIDLSAAFANYYREHFGVAEKYQEGYFNRGWKMYYAVAAIDLTTPFGIPEYGKGSFGR
jgi:N-acetylmuramoyl-L-alanine amidase